MPSLKMKTKLSTGALREKKCLGVCQKSSVITKKSCPHITVSRQTAEFDMCIQRCQDGCGKKLHLKNADASLR